MKLAVARIGISVIALYSDRSLIKYFGRFRKTDILLLGAQEMTKDIFTLEFVEQIFIDHKQPSMMEVWFTPNYTNMSVDEMAVLVGESIAYTLDGDNLIEWLEPKDVESSYLARCHNAETDEGEPE